MCSTQRSLSTEWECTHLKSRHPFVLVAQQLISSSDDNYRSAALWADYINGMRSGWRTLQDPVLSSPKSATTLQEWPCPEQRGSGLTASLPVSGVSAPAYTRRSMAPFAACECAADKQTADHVVLHCPIHRSPHRAALLNRWAAAHWWAAKLLQVGREMFRDNAIITPSHEF